MKSNSFCGPFQRWTYICVLETYVHVGGLLAIVTAIFPGKTRSKNVKKVTKHVWPEKYVHLCKRCNNTQQRNRSTIRGRNALGGFSTEINAVTASWVHHLSAPTHLLCTSHISKPSTRNIASRYPCTIVQRIQKTSRIARKGFLSVWQTVLGRASISRAQPAVLTVSYFSYIVCCFSNWLPSIKLPKRIFCPIQSN